MRGIRSFRVGIDSHSAFSLGSLCTSPIKVSTYFDRTGAHAAHTPDAHDSLAAALEVKPEVD